MTDADLRQRGLFINGHLLRHNRDTHRWECDCGGAWLCKHEALNGARCRNAAEHELMLKGART